MSKELEKKIEKLFLHKENVIDSNILENIIIETFNKKILVENKSSKFKEVDESDILQFLPKFEFTEDVGTENTLARQMFDNLIGKTLAGLPDLESKIKHLENFCSTIPEKAGSDDVSDILSNLVILKMLINIFNRSSYGSAGMQFESFIAGLMGGQQTKRDITSNVLDVTINNKPYQIKVLKNISDTIDMSVQNMDKHFFEKRNTELNFLIVDKMGRDVSNTPSNITGLKFYSGSMSKEQYQSIRPTDVNQKRVLVPKKDFYKNVIGTISIEKSILDQYGDLLQNKVKITLIEVAKLINNINSFYIQGIPDKGVEGVGNANRIAKNLKAQYKAKNLNSIIFFLRESVKQELEEELESQDELMKSIKKALSGLEDISYTTSNKSDMAIVVRVDDKEEIESTKKAVRSAVKKLGVTLEDKIINKFDPSNETTIVEYSDGSGRVYIVYKYDIGSREGLALEHIIEFLFNRKITSQLKNRLDLPEEAEKEKVLETLKGEFVNTLRIAVRGKKLVEKKVGKITNAESVGSTNNKADLILTTSDNKRIGLSIKLVTEEGRGVRFTYNKNLGYGDESEDNLVRNPSGKPWWLVGRQIFASKVGSRKYNPGVEDFEPPSWMTSAKEKHPDLYKEAMSEVYEKIRDVLATNLRRMKLKELVDMVNEAHLGGKEERKQYDSFLKLTATSEGVELNEEGFEKPDIEKIKANNLTKNDIVKQEDSLIIIDIPGMTPLTIHSVKFHSNMLSGKRDDLKIKTR